MRSLRILPLILGGLAVAAAAAAAPRIVLFDAAEGMTARALQAVGAAATVVPPADYGTSRLCLFDYQVAIIGMDVEQAALNADPAPLQEFVRSGGVVLAMRSQQEIGWSPVPLKLDKAYELGALARADHPLLTTPHRLDLALLNKVHGGSIYRACYDLGAGWQPILSTGAEQSWDKTSPASAGPHYGLLDLPFGKGHIIVCQLIPDYGLINDDKGQPGPSRQLLENLVAYVGAVAPAWPAPRPRVVPVSFHLALTELLRPPSGGGALPLADAAWKAKTKGAFTCKADRRGVLTMSAADAPAVAGDYAEITRTVPLAPGATYLRFYNSDDYCGGTEPNMVGDARVSTRENRIRDVRLKQVLVNGQVVWSQDVLGRNPVPADRRFYLLDIGRQLGQGKTAELTLRVVNQAGTADDQPFATDVYWAGVELLPVIVHSDLERGSTGFAKTEQGLALTGGKGSLQAAFRGPAGRYAVLARVLDEHTGRSRLQVAAGGASLPAVQLTADNRQWYWIDLGRAELKPGSVVRLQATGDGEERCVVEAFAFIPAGALATPAPATAAAAGSPLLKPAPAVTRASFPVLVSGPETYQPHGEVVSGGMPFAYGAVKSEQNLRLLNDQGREVPLQTRVLARWPDGSLKWVLFTFPTAPGEVRCEYGSQVRRERPDPEVAVVNGDSIEINTGLLQAKVSKTGGDLLSQLSLEGKAVKGPETPWAVCAVAGGKQYSSARGTPERVELVENGPWRATVRRVGRLQAEDGATLLEYDLTMQFDRGSSVVRFQPVITHKEASAEEKLSLVTLVAPLAWQQQGAGVQHWVEVDGTWQQAGPELSLSQDDDQHSAVNYGVAQEGPGTALGDPARRKSGFVRLVSPSLGVDFIPRWFWQMAPKTVSVLRSGYQVALLRGEPFTIHQGEAIWNDFALRFSDETAKPETRDFEALASPPAALADPQHTARTLALGEFMPEDRGVYPEYEDTVAAQYKAYLAKREARHEYGVQNFGDDTFEWGYGPVYTFWSNQEYDHHYAMLLQYLRSGDWYWWEIGDQGARHHRDEDCYHWAPGREYLLGSPHHHNSRHIVEQGWFPDHTVAGSDVTHAWVEGQIAYYYLTGDARMLENWQAMGDWYVWCVNNNRYGAGGQERGPGWTLVALSALYNATYDRKYLEAGGKVMDWLRSVQDPVRGVVSIPISEQPSYEGGSAFMHGIVARGAGRWYEASGDVRGKLAALGIADWLTSEAMGPPALFYYKQAPRQKHGYSISEWQCFTALSYGTRYGDAGWYGPLAEAHYLSGRAGERSMAWVPQSLAHLRPRFSPYRARLVSSSLTVAPDQPGEVKLVLGSTADKPQAVTLATVSAPAGVAVTPPSGTLTIPPHGQLEVAVPVRVRDLATAAGTLELRLTSPGAERRYRVTIVGVPHLVRVERSAAAGQLQAPFALQADKSAAAARDASFTGNPRAVGERAGWISWEVDLPVAGNYLLSADCYWLDDKGNSFFVQVDDGPELTFGNDGEMGRWHAVATPEPLALAAGKHTVRLLNREDGGKVRGITLVNTP